MANQFISERGCPRVMKICLGLFKPYEQKTEGWGLGGFFKKKKVSRFFKCKCNDANGKIKYKMTI